MSRIGLLATLLASCALPLGNDVTISTARLSCPSLGTVTARDREGLRRRARAAGGNHVTLLDEAPRPSRRFASPPKKPSPPLEVYFANDRWLVGDVLRCGTSLSRPRRVPAPARGSWL